MFDKLKQLFAVKKPSIAMPRPAGATFPALWKSETFEAMARQILSMPDPDAILRKAGIRRTTLKKLLYDDEIYQAVSTRLDGLSIVPVRLEPTETKESKFIQTRCLTQEFLKVILAGAFDALLYGYSVMEIIWDKESYDY
jgi:hypothetical protein